MDTQLQLPIFNNSAWISADGLYRFNLRREWSLEKPSVMFLMLNPSRADESTNDHTIRKCIAYAKQWGYGGLWVGNR